MGELEDRTSHFESLNQQVRVIMLLDAAENAGIVPLRIVPLHALAYLSNVLAPVWDIRPLDGRLLKRRGGPFYPELQRDLDRLVGTGIVTITGLDHVPDDDGRWRLEGSYQLNRGLSQAVIDYLSSFEEEQRLASFIRELAYALSALTDDDLSVAVQEDATYSDPLVSVDNVVDFAEWRHTNYSSNAAQYFDRLIPGGTHATLGEKLHLYARHLNRRIHDRI
jgi:hypothetical protein